MEQVTLTERGLKELNDLQRGELRIGSSLTIGNYWLPEKISLFKRRYRNIIVDCRLANTEEICEGTATGVFDLGLVEGEVKSSLKSDLEEEVVGGDRLFIVVGKAHPWFERQAVLLSELSTTDWVMRESGSGTQQRFEEALQNWSFELNDLNIILVLNSGEMVKAVVESGVGATGISELMVEKELRLDTLRSIRVIDERDNSTVPVEIRRPFLKLKHRQRFQTRLVAAFEHILSLQPSYSIIN
jgi:DNA-binding transcriptional LysR family regulator